MSEKIEATFRGEPTASDPREVRRVVETTGFFRPDEVEVAVELVEERMAKGIGSGYLFWFAEIEDVLAGYCCFGPTPCTVGSYDLYWIVVDAKWQGLGLGLELMQMTEDAIRERGGKRIYVETSGKAQYASTRGFYKRAGYFEAATLPDFYDAGDNKVIYQKNI